MFRESLESLDLQPHYIVAATRMDVEELPQFLVCFVLRRKGALKQIFAGISGAKIFPSSRRRISRFEKYREAWSLMTKNV